MVTLRKFFLQRIGNLETRRPLPEETSRNLLELLCQIHIFHDTYQCDLLVLGNPPIYRFWKDDLQQRDSFVPNTGTARMVETTAYALLTSLNLKDMNYVNPVIKWLSEEQRYGGGFYSTQVVFLSLVLSSWRCP